MATKLRCLPNLRQQEVTDDQENDEGRPRKRRRATGKPLLVYMRQVLAKSSGGMRPKDVAAAVTRAGYKSYSKDFYAVVAKALLDRKNFQRVSRGVYKLAK